jgi:hypothetical protein
MYHQSPSMRPAVKKSLGLVAFMVMVLSLLATLVRPRLPGSEMSRPEVIAIPIQIVLTVLAFR